LKNFSGLYPQTPVKGEGRKGRTEGERRGLGTQSRRRGVLWDREGEERMRVIQRKGKGRKKQASKRKMTWPPKKFLDPPLEGHKTF
jgi:hypothetical protein